MSIQHFSEKLKYYIWTNSIGDFIETIHEIIERDSVDLEAVLNYQTETTTSPIHLSTSNLKFEFVRLLLLHGANPNLQDNGGRTPILTAILALHDCSCFKCQSKCTKCINYLGEDKGNMDIGDFSGETPLHASTSLGVEEPTLALLSNGASLGTHNSRSMVSILLDRNPNLILPILDQAITITMDYKQRHDLNFKLEFDMSVIMPYYKSHCFERTEEQPGYPQREMTFLAQLVASKSFRNKEIKRSILRHPLVHFFTDIKWKRLRLLYYFYLMSQVNILMCYSLFLFLVIFMDCPFQRNRTTYRNITLNENGINAGKNIEIPEYIEHICKMSVATKGLGFYVLACCVVSILKEMIHVMFDMKAYFLDLSNHVQLIGIFTVSATAVSALHSTQIEMEHTWLYPLACFGETVSWLQLFLHMGRLPGMGTYVDMLTKITVNFCSSLAMYSFIVIAFAMSYCMLFPMETKWLDFPFAIIRVLTMMIGELNYETLFSPENNIRSPILAHLWYAVLLILISMVLMNLLVGLAVNNISECQMKSEIVVMKRKIHYLTYLENSFFLFTALAPKFLKTLLQKRIGVVAPMPSGVSQWSAKEKSENRAHIVTVYPNRVHDGKLQPETRYSIRKWVEAKAAAPHQAEKCCAREQSEHKLHHKKGHTNSFSENGKHNQMKKSLTRESVYSSKSISKKNNSDTSETNELAQTNNRLNQMLHTLQRLEDRILHLDAKVEKFSQAN